MMHNQSTQRRVVALAGRRVDASSAKQRRFPAENVGLVAGRIRGLLEELKPVALVCSAASGADLIALDVAGQLGIERHIIIPFAAEIFRQTSVADSGAEWGERFDGILEQLAKNEEIVSANYAKRGNEAYQATNVEILRRAQQLASAHDTTAEAVIVWNGVARQAEDNTNEFANAARRAGLAVREILTV